MDHIAHIGCVPLPESKKAESYLYPPILPFHAKRAVKFTCSFPWDLNLHIKAKSVFHDKRTL